MATTIQQPPKIGNRSSSDGNGDWRNLVPADGHLRLIDEHAAPPASTGIWVLLASITMMFAAFTSALIVRKGGSNDWYHFALPPILYFNSTVLIISSVTVEIARRQIRALLSGTQEKASHPTRWLYITFFLGLVFVMGQYAAWLDLRSQGLFLATNPSSSFFYLLTCIHALHVLGGMAAMARVLLKLHRSTLRIITLDATTRYWHFMGGLWLYLLCFLWVKL
jgi:cytochrome c oxidase subunit 3